jgi:excinuclease UvrABC helicase subunit UvrB
MTDSNFQHQAEWARFYLYLLKQITTATERAERAAERMTDTLREQTGLLEKQNQLLELRVIFAEEVRAATLELHGMGDGNAEKNR